MVIQLLLINNTFSKRGSIQCNIKDKYTAILQIETISPFYPRFFE